MFETTDIGLSDTVLLDRHSVFPREGYTTRSSCICPPGEKSIPPLESVGVGASPHPIEDGFRIRLNILSNYPNRASSLRRLSALFLTVHALQYFNFRPLF